jgi:NitT/TauT family transport system substrate-binding protein
VDRVRFARYGGATARVIFAPLCIGLARGYFREAGIEVDELEPEEQPWQTVGEGRADCGAGFIDYCADPRWAGRMKAVLVHERFRPGHGLTTLLARRALVESGRLTADCATLRGCAIGLGGGRGDDFLAWYGVLRQGGLSLDDVRPVPVPHGEEARQKALREGAVDVVIGRRPRGVANDVARGLVVRWKVGDEVHPDLQARYILFARSLLEDRPDVGVRFLTAYLRGVRDYCDAFDAGRGREEMLELLVRETGESRELLTSMKPLGFMPDGRVDRDRLALEGAALAEHGLLPPGTDPESLVERGPAEAALDALGH